MTPGWVLPQSVLIKTVDFFKRHQVKYPINTNDSKPLCMMKQKYLHCLYYEGFCPRHQLGLYARGAYFVALSSRTLAGREEINYQIATQTCQVPLITPIRKPVSAKTGRRTGYQHFPAMVQRGMKTNCRGSPPRRFIPGSLCSSSLLPPYALTPQPICLGYRVLLGMRARDAPRQHFDLLTWHPTTGMTRTKSEYQYLQDRHFLTYADLVTCSGTGWLAVWRYLSVRLRGSP